MAEMSVLVLSCTTRVCSATKQDLKFSAQKFAACTLYCVYHSLHTHFPNADVRDNMADGKTRPERKCLAPG